MPVVTTLPMLVGALVPPPPTTPAVDMATPAVVLWLTLTGPGPSGMLVADRVERAEARALEAEARTEEAGVVTGEETPVAEPVCRVTEARAQRLEAAPRAAGRAMNQHVFGRGGE